MQPEGREGVLRADADLFDAHPAVVDNVPVVRRGEAHLRRERERTNLVLARGALVGKALVDKEGRVGGVAVLAVQRGGVARAVGRVALELRKLLSRRRVGRRADGILEELTRQARSLDGLERGVGARRRVEEGSNLLVAEQAL